MNERMHFIRMHQCGQHSVSELCRRFGVSRKTGYKWLGRYTADGGCSDGMQDRSRRPHTHPRSVPGWLEEAIVQARKQRPHWGPKKLRTVLVRSNPGRPSAPSPPPTRSGAWTSRATSRWAACAVIR